MCTAAWIPLDGPRGSAGYELLFNRDELRSRGPAHPPSRRDGGRLPWLAPTDADAGGTWLAANAAGVTIALLNGYLDLDGDTGGRPAGGPWTSRGLVVAELADSASAAEVARRLAARDLRRVRSFVVLALEPAREVRLVRWDGERLDSERREWGAGGLLSSSSLDPGGARETREALFAALHGADGRVDPAELRALFASHRPERGPRSVCMHRADAATVSHTRVRVLAERVELDYVAGPPCEGAPPATLALERAPAAAPTAARRT